MLFAQEININLPEKANQPYVLALNQGLKSDTVRQGRLDGLGKAKIEIQGKYAKYRGASFLKIGSEDALNLIVNNERFTITQDDSKQYQFKGSVENEYLYDIIRLGKSEAVVAESLYAKEFISILRYVGDLNRFFARSSATFYEESKMLDYAMNNVNYESLYTSGLWFYVVDGLVKLHSNQDLLGKDVIAVLDKIKSPEVYEYLTENIITITQQYGLDDAFDIVIPHIMQSGRIKTPTGDIYAAFRMAKVLKGQKAPALVGLKPAKEDSYDKTIIIFFQSGCTNCEEEIERLKKDYLLLEQKKIRVVAVSADEDRDEFAAKTTSFPWTDTLCDFEGFSGDNFINYGVMSTPMVYLVDENWTLIGRYASYTGLKLD